MAIDVADLAFVKSDGRWGVEPGLFDLWVTAGPDAPLHAVFEVA